MNPIEALQYMKTTGKTVVAEKIPPCNWIAKEPGVNQWIKHRYQFMRWAIIELYDDAPVAATVVKVWDEETWLNHWMNFFYNTNSSDYNIELIPYECD